MAEVISKPADPKSKVERILGEEPIGAAVVARRMARVRLGKPTNAGTVVRWMTTGILRHDGTRAFLEAIRLNNRWVTSWPRVLAFIEAQQFDPTARHDDRADADRTPKQRNAAAESAVAELERMGA